MWPDDGPGLPTGRINAWSSRLANCSPWTKSSPGSRMFFECLKDCTIRQTTNNENKPKKNMQQTLYFRPAKSKIFTIWPFTEKVCRPCFSSIPHFADEENWSQKVSGWGCVFIFFPTTNGEAGNDRNVLSHSLEARSSKSRCQEGGPLLEALRGKPFLVSLRFWCLQATLGVPWSTDVSLKTLPLSSHDILQIGRVSCRERV